MQAARSLILLTAPVLLEAVCRSRSPVVREWIVSLLSRFAYLSSVQKRRRNEEALNSYFQGRLTDSEIRTLNVSLFEMFWRDFVEIVRFESEASSLRTIEIKGLQYLDDVLAEGRGCVLWESSTFGRRNLAKQILALHGYRLEQVHLEGHLLGLGTSVPVPRWVSRLATRWLLRWEYQFIERLHEIPLDGSLAYLRGILRSLGQNQIICSTADGQSGQKWVNIGLLGGVLRVSTGMMSLSSASGTPIIPIFCYSKGNSDYRVELTAPIRLSEGGDRQADYYRAAGEYVRALEERSLRYPNQRCNWPLPASVAQSPTESEP